MNQNFYFLRPLPLRQTFLKVAVTTAVSLLLLMQASCTTVEEKVVRTPAPQTSTALDNPVVTAQHAYNASPARVWEVLTTTAAIRRWWGPHGFTAQIKKNDFKQGGRFLFGMESTGFPLSWNIGTYTVIIPQKKIVMKMNFADDNGRAVPAAKLGMPGQWADFVQVVLDLREENGQTVVKVTQTGIPAEMSQPANMGWVQQFDKIDKILTE